jgi:hypothetical protein
MMTLIETMALPGGGVGLLKVPAPGVENTVTTALVASGPKNPPRPKRVVFEKGNSPAIV